MSRRPPADALVVATDERAHAKAAGLVYVCDTDDGITRCRRGKSFQYIGIDGKRVTDEEVLTRIRSLAIPPAYTQVWICPHPRGHLQATGRDARARKQYRYHAKWRSERDRGKFTRILEFGAALPALRRRLRKDLSLPGLPRNKVLALVVSLLEETMIRVGNDAYARQNHSFGLTTLRSRHVEARRGRIEFHFRGKSGQWRDVVLDDRRLVKAVRRVQELPGQRLFQYVDDEGQRQPIDSGMVNDYLRDVTGGEFTAKDFRTWGGTVQAVAVLAATPIPHEGGERAMKAALAQAVKDVAAVLGNTPAVCRASYIHPEVFLGWADGELHRQVAPVGPHQPRKLEALTLAFLRRRLRAGKRSP
ncbi:DNA topoisomerase IB [Luteibacter aegosomatissinici]|uniref:DNA topoisomerase IB n=1 Tax=Luteibacter aegosomatissinici TaxID=2911539 RepID=UPI001FF72CC8|nr:DNA topoisomerase IB [Luteibacter aegosomatissinici]UPG95007.1 DNA topoisomerase IB [Luteibacter aegosomatissinici]